MEQIDRALDIALIVIKNGGSTVAADRTFRNVIKGYKLKEAFVSWRLDFITANTDAAGSSSVMRSVGEIKVNLTRASEAILLGERVAKGQVSTNDLLPEIERIQAIAPPYNKWLMMLIAALTAATYTQVMQGDWGALGIAFVAAGFGQLLRSQLQGMNFAIAPVTLASGILSACIATLGLRLGFSQEAPSTLISSVIYLVPGLPLINGFFDVLSHKFLFIGFERIANALYLLLIIAIAITLAYVLIIR